MVGNGVDLKHPETKEHPCIGPFEMLPIYDFLIPSSSSSLKINYETNRQILSSQRRSGECQD